MSVIHNYNIESGDLTGLSQSGSDISVSAGAALGGSNYGLAVLVDDTTTNYLYNSSNPGAQTTGKARIRFYIDPNSITIGNGTAIGVFTLRYSVQGWNLVLVILLKTGTQYYIVSYLYNDAGTSSSASYAITDAPHYVELNVIRATNATSNDGSLQTWIDGTSQGTITGVDNYDRFANWEYFRWGAITKDASQSGTFYTDELIVNNDGGEIGPLSATVNITAAENTETNTSDAASLTFTGTYNVTAAENTQAQTSDAASISFTAIGAIDITAAENTQAQTSDAAGITVLVTGHGSELVNTIDPAIVSVLMPDYVLTPAKNTQAQTSDAASLTFTGPTYAITPAENSQGGISDPAIITFTGPTWAVTGAEGTQTHTSDPAVITFTGPTYPVTPAENTQTQDSDAAVVTFGLVTSLTAAENTQSQTSDSAVIYAVYSLTGAENTHTQVSDAASITFNGIGTTNVTAAENSHAQTSDTATISVLHPLIGPENTQSQTSDAVSLTFTAPGYGITAGENTQAQISDVPLIRAIYPILGAENTQAQTSDPAMVILAALILHGSRQLYRPDARMTHRAPARVTLEVDDD